MMVSERRGQTARKDDEEASVLLVSISLLSSHRSEDSLSTINRLQFLHTLIIIPRCVGVQQKGANEWDEAFQHQK